MFYPVNTAPADCSTTTLLMEFLTGTSTSPNFFRRFNPVDFNDGAVPVIGATGSGDTPCSPLLPTELEHANANNSTASEGSEPSAEPLDLSTRSEKEERSGQDLEEPVSDASETYVLDFSTKSGGESPAKLASVKFCECFTGKHQVGNYFACYCNSMPVFILRSKLQPLLEDEEVQNIETVSHVPQRSPSIIISSLDSSPPQLVMDLPSSSSDTDLNSPRKGFKQASFENAEEKTEPTRVEALSLSQEARHIYKFESDEDLKSLGTFSGYKSKAGPMKAITSPSETKKGLSSEIHYIPEIDQETLEDHHVHHASDLDVTQDISTRPPMPGSDTTIISIMGDVSEQHDTHAYNADVSATQITGIDSSVSDDDPNASTWFIIEEDNSSSDLRLKLCKTFVIRDSDKDTGGRQGSEHAERGLHDKTFSRVIKQSENTEGEVNPCSNASQQPASPSPNMNATIRYVEGRSICEASTIFSASPTFVATTPMSSCVSYPATPDISFHSSKNASECVLSVTPTRHRPVVAEGRISSTPNARGPVSMKDACRVTKTAEEISLRKAMFKKKVSAQGSDSILNLGFTSELELNQHDLPPSKNKDDEGIFKKPKWSKKMSILKALKRRFMCQSNMSIMSTLNNSAQNDPSCSERVKAALQPLTTITKGNRFRAPNRPTMQPSCGKTATTSTATVAFATLSETKQSQASGHVNPAQSKLEELNPRLNAFSSVRSSGTTTSTLTHLVAPLDLSLPNSTNASIQSPHIRSSLANGCNFHPHHKSSSPVMAKMSSSADQDLFKVPKNPPSPRTPAKNLGRPLSSLNNLHQERNLSGRAREHSEVTARTCTESSLSESNVMSWATQQSFDIKMVRIFSLDSRARLYFNV